MITIDTQAYDPDTDTVYWCYHDVTTTPHGTTLKRYNTMDDAIRDLIDDEIEYKDYLDGQVTTDVSDRYVPVERRDHVRVLRFGHPGIERGDIDGCDPTYTRVMAWQAE
jgi:hypothetical protein